MPAELPPLPRDADASGRDLGAAELEALAEVLQAGTLNVTRGAFGPRLEAAFAARMGAPHAVACASGSAAVHAAVAALGLELGSEVVTSPITDMGALMPLVYEGLVPVFCDVDPDTGNVTAEAIAARLTERTRAVVVTHLFGRPCAMDAIMALARAHDLVVVEDCAQAYLASVDGRMVGSFGAAACYSFQQSKHMTTGEGGAVTTAVPELAARVRQFVNKGWGYGCAQPDHDFPALNYRMSELQAAVGVAQLAKLDGVVARRRASATRFLAALQDQGGARWPELPAGVAHSFWRLGLLVEDATMLAQRLAGLGVAAQPHYIQKPAYACRVFREWRRFAVTRAVFERAGHEPAPPAGSMPGTEEFLRRVLVLPWNEFFTDADADRLADAVLAGVAQAAR